MLALPSLALLALALSSSSPVTAQQADPDQAHLGARWHHRMQRWHAPHYRRRMDVEPRELDERGLPITATTIVRVEMTTTQTVWVQPTDQAHWDVPSGSSSSAGASMTSSAVAEDATSTSAAGSASASPSASASASASASLSDATYSASASTSDSSTLVSPSYSSYSSASLSPSSSAITSSATASPSSSLQAQDQSSSAPSAISSSASASASASASVSLSKSASSSTSVESSSASSASVSESASASASASASSSDASAITSSATEASWSSASHSASASLNQTVSDSQYSQNATAPVTSAVTASSTAITSAITSSATSANSSSMTASATLVSSSTVTASSTSSASTGRPTGALPDVIMNGYYADWAGDSLPPEDVDWDKFDVVDFAFALPTSSYGLEFTQDDSSDLLKRLVAGAHAAGKRVKLSIGGWTGSTYFSTICGSSSARKTFLGHITSAYDTYELDGIDIDWEYPGTSGAEGNAVSSSDAANFLTFLQEMRDALPSGALISLATQVWPFTGSDGNPLSDVSAFADVIDWILIMNYDIWGSSSTPGPNAPLSDACGNSTQPLANAYAAVSSWTSAGMPASKITLGVPAYGYLQKSTATSLVQRRDHMLRPDRSGRRSSYITVENDDGGTTDGQVMFVELIQQGALELVDGEYVGGGGFTREWDECSHTPWLKSTKSGQIVTYDDPESMSLKGQFAAQAGLRGCNVFSMDGDWTGSSWPLTDAVRSGLDL